MGGGGGGLGGGEGGEFFVENGVRLAKGFIKMGFLDCTDGVLIKILEKRPKDYFSWVTKIDFFGCIFRLLFFFDVMIRKLILVRLIKSVQMSIKI